jgi:DNA-binding MarR family transcriptional regulator
MAASSPASDAWRLIFELVMEHRRSFQDGVAELDLTAMQAYALKNLDPERPLGMGELAATLRCDASNVTGIVDRLEARGAVERRPAPNDRRVKTLAVTPAGAELRRAVLALMHEPPPAIHALSLADQRALRDLLERAVAPAPVG